MGRAKSPRAAPAAKTSTRAKQTGASGKRGQRKPPADAHAQGVHSVSSRESTRSQLAADVEKFLKAGGEITTVPRNFRADPPRKPENNYGRGSI